MRIFFGIFEKYSLIEKDGRAVIRGTWPWIMALLTLPPMHWENGKKEGQENRVIFIYIYQKYLNL